MKTNLIIVALLSLTTLYLASIHGSETNQINDEREVSRLKTIVWLGDSLTGDSEKSKEQFDRFPQIVAAQHPDYEFMIQGRSGWSVSSYLKHWGKKVRRSLPEHADVVVVQLGTNDLRVDGLNDATLEKYENNMLTLLNRLKKLYPEAEFITMTPANFVMNELVKPIRKAGFDDSSNEWLEKMGKRLESLSETWGADCISLFGTLEPGDTTDGAHPNEEGHKNLAKRVNENWPIQSRSGDL